MADVERGPWGIIVTKTLHLTPANTVERPACWDSRVQQVMDGYRRRWREGGYDTPPIFGEAEGRPVCKKCINAKENEIARAREVLAEVLDYVGGR